MQNKIYFLVAAYFRFFAQIVLNRWQPRIIVVTGSAGKSAAIEYFYQLLQTEYQIKKTEHANSAIGVPLDILGIHPKNYSPLEWLRIFFLIFFNCLKLYSYPYKESIYLVELDADRPGEMKFFSQFIQPEIIFWVSSYATHTANFQDQSTTNLPLAVAKEYAKISKQLKSEGLLIVNGDNLEIKQALNQEESVLFIKKDNQECGFSNYQVNLKETSFTVHYQKEHFFITLPYLLPEEIGYTLTALLIVSKYFKIGKEKYLQTLVERPTVPGRYSVFKGINKSFIVDSSYNSSLLATIGLIKLLKRLPGERKIAVLGDMRELGKESESNHLALAKVLTDLHPEQIILVGPNMKNYVYPFLLKNGYPTDCAHWFENTYAAGLFIKESLVKEGDIILVKSSQNTLFFEIIVELLLLNKEDTSLLCRRETIWEAKRKQIINQFYESLKK